MYAETALAYENVAVRVFNPLL